MWHVGDENRDKRGENQLEEGLKDEYLTRE
jgi:hypothetical protein